jgi:UDP-N-acetyl-D-glucosamine/UDP-N-acetyl-D-galactosamine dehydrogenase
MERIAVVGLGYVGLPLALALAEKFPGAVGFDTNRKKIDNLRNGVDSTGETAVEALKNTTLEFSSDPAMLRKCNMFIIAVPTPIDNQKRPDLTLLKSASEIVGSALRPGAVVVFESTVYPGVTEEFCGPILERTSTLKRGRDFRLGYSPERINPGDRLHTIDKITKVVSGEDAETLDRVAGVYGAIVSAGVYRASSIKVAEAAKVIENTQRDLNIALMNELSIIFDRIGISTRDVLAAAATKWNFLPFKPGLVGGHCIGVDPYYLTSKAEELGYHPQVILAGRRINDNMGLFIAQKTAKLLVKAGRPLNGARVGILGLTFKENVSDLRNSRVPEIANELREFGINVLIHDPLVSTEDATAEYGVSLQPIEEFSKLDGVIFAVAHEQFKKLAAAKIVGMLKSEGGVVVDVKAIFDPGLIAPPHVYWSL